MRADRWFHTLVVVGASLSGCGGRAHSPGEGEGGGPAGAGSASGGMGANGGAAAGVGGSGGAPTAGGTGAMPPLDPVACSSPQQFVCDSYEPLTNCSCDDLRPQYQEDCEQQIDFQCRGVTVRGVFHYVACYCERPEFTPQDCPVPETFRCNVTSPSFLDCGCDGDVVRESDCDPAAGVCCQSEQPRFGCSCCSVVIK